MTTSTYRKLQPVHAINRFLWDRISSESLMNKIPYKGVQLTPLVPIEETPELITAIEAQPGMGTMPFIVYNWTKVDSGQMWMVETHEIAYSIRSADNTATNQLINLFDDCFKDYDEAGQRVDAYVQANVTSAELRRFRFHSINISTLGGQMPTDTDDGTNESLISIRALFTQDSAK